MENNFRTIKFPETYKYSSDSNHIPLEFYEITFPIAKRIDLLLGYFSTNAIKILSESFAEFIYNGGEMRIVTNHVMAFRDWENLIDKPYLENEDVVIDIFKDETALEQELSQHGKHFFDCLKYLLKEKRLQIVPVIFNKVDLAHCKEMILYDGQDYISTDGSINFTLAALTKNSESFEVNAPWQGEIFERRVTEAKNRFEKIFNKEHGGYQYIDADKIERIINYVGRDKNIKDLLDDSLELEDSTFNNRVKILKEERRKRFQERLGALNVLCPKFPYRSGPHEYQIKAYDAWKQNKRRGLFAMATGTGKTITALNIVLKEFIDSGYYKVIILVPTNPLVTQWTEVVSECAPKGFNFRGVYTSQDYKWNDTLERKLLLKHNFIFISTYASFCSVKSQHILNKYQETLSDAILIADEAHNIGATSISKLMPKFIDKRIGLSATPHRKYDNIGSDFVSDYFSSASPCYTFSYSMHKAIANGVLSEYEYRPYFTTLTSEELKRYIKLSKELVKYMDDEGRMTNNKAAKLLIQRKAIINKAENKKQLIVQILKDCRKEFGDKFKYFFVYVPEGYEPNYSIDSDTKINQSEKSIIGDYAKIIGSQFGYTISEYLGDTKNRDLILDQFKRGQYDGLLAMKCLDEGVDVPRTQFAIFCSSTGNPRQFIQRRGRVLRTHDDKKVAYVFDMIIKPNYGEFELDEKLYKYELKAFKSELGRVLDFLSLAKNRDKVLKGELGEICLRADVEPNDHIYNIIKEHKQCDYDSK